MDLGVGLEFGRRAFEDDFAGFEDVAITGNLEGEVGILFNQENGQALGAVDLDNFFKDGLHEEGRDAEGGLIEHEELWLAEECPANRQHLLFTAGKGAGELLAAFEEAGEYSEDVVGLGGGPGGIALEIGSHLEVFLHRQVGEDHAAFRNMAKPAADDGVGRLIGDLPTVIADGAAGRFGQAGDGSQGGGITGTIAADEGDDAAGRHLERDAVQGFDRPIGDAEVIDREQVVEC